MGAKGLGFKVQSPGFAVWGLGFRAQVKVKVGDLKPRAQGLVSDLNQRNPTSTWWPCLLFSTYVLTKVGLGGLNYPKP